MTPFATKGPDTKSAPFGVTSLTSGLQVAPLVAHLAETAASACELESQTTPSLTAGACAMCPVGSGAIQTGRHTAPQAIGNAMSPPGNAATYAIPSATVGAASFPPPVAVLHCGA